MSCGSKCCASLAKTGLVLSEVNHALVELGVVPNQ